ncbi:uncharacterized protein STEHIDRAFT_56056 [Stereum hirsutum FP-91666 SS1]|uniref:uncharacterized protein n=1 Tax=Stereum hirsutum (strain FP-91666) TaxID=721885 RepID=UPI000440BD3E|nr:uncharacterized protein STEHIDRAFT_56056 [Stereum hirsutum FP-91666 SS1]EIM87685.1 hypothetical protein STEHIDRAFT_56056 [Stereum hirsutum FP-91666 SS1]
MSLPEPPTAATIASARQVLHSTQSELSALQSRLQDAEAKLAKFVAESKCAINEMQQEQSALEDKVAHTLAYVSPIRRLPQELLRQIFLINFEDFPCCAWIRLITSPNISADTIRLWLERSGSRVPLDIEIFLQVQSAGSAATSLRPPPRSTSPWPYPTPSPSAPQYVQIHHASHPSAIQIIPTATPIVLPPSPPSHDHMWGAVTPVPPHQSASSSSATQSQTRAISHWGHIAIFYLVEQIHRWERFIFRFDKQFSSFIALKSISGHAPLLKEFEVSSAEPVYCGDWSWLPSTSPQTHVDLPELRSLTLQYTPFKWSSPIFKTNLRKLNLRSLPTTNIALDRILYMVSNNRGLEELSLSFSSVNPAILPLTSTTLPELKSLTLGGHYLLANLIDIVVLPSLASLTLAMEARDPIEDNITSLLSRSNHPPVTELSVAYAYSGSPYYYNGGGLISSWNFLADMSYLRTLQLGSTPLDPILSALGPPDDDNVAVGGNGSWLCPYLEHLAFKACPAHADGISKLVQLVDLRNPEGGAGHGSGPGGGGGSSNSGSSSALSRLKKLEMYDCTMVGQDVVDWLKGRIPDVMCVEPTYERCGYSIVYQWH